MASTRTLPAFISNYESMRRSHVDCWCRVQPEHAIVWRNLLRHWTAVQKILTERARSLGVRDGHVWTWYRLHVHQQHDTATFGDAYTKNLSRLLQHPIALCHWLADAFRRHLKRDIAPKTMLSIACRIVNLCAPVTAVEAFAIATSLPREIVNMIALEFVPPEYRR